MKIWLFSSLVLFAALSPVQAGSWITYDVAGQSYEGYFEAASPESPLVLLVHDWDGLTDYEVKRAEMLSELGYAVFCADLFGKGIRPTELKDKRKCTGELDADRARMRLLMQGALDTAKSHGGNVGRCVAMGYCFGGTAVLEFARSGADLKGFATFHGGLALPEGQDYSKTKGQVLIQHGSADTNVTLDQFAKLSNDLEQAGVSNEMITYGGAPHAWTVFGSESYREDADKKSWRRFTEFLVDTLK
ncbi:MAG: dienelactone hydrolase family protein [Kiritimatiellales bacterium]|nr:dienelactone hydrolase family protein [Kiritimatiellales bacterium]